MRYLTAILILAFALVSQTGFAHDYTATVAASKPAVVTLVVSNKFRWRKTEEQKRAEQLFEKHADLFEEKPQKRTARSYGSGFLISDDGKILTAAHVVSDPASIVVRLANGKKVGASVVEVDKQRDVALLQIKNLRKIADLKPLALSNSPVLEGQPVLVMGGAFGLPISTSSGIISAVDVKLSKRNKHSVVLTDAATNPGSSGGPLLDEDGLVIGMISRIYSNTGSFSGTAVALPAAELNSFLSK